MSRLVEKLNQVSLAAPQPIGFRAGQSASPKPKMLLIASMPQVITDNLAAYVAGADAGLLPISQKSGVKALHEVSQAVPDLPWGAWLKDSGQAKIDEMVKASCDFVVFAADSTSIAIPPSDSFGKIIEVYVPTLSDGFLRAINDLPVDAVLIAQERSEEHSLTWHDLILFRHAANLLTKPMLVPIPANVMANELQTLWEAGVDGVIIEIGVGQPEGRISELRQAIDKLATPLGRKRGKAEALLPRIGQEKETVSEEEE